MTTRRILFTLLVAMTAVAICGTSYAQTLIGSSGAGWQTWTPAVDLNNDSFPYWDSIWSNSLGNQSAANAGYCLTATGDCNGLASGLFAPGALPFWGTSFISGIAAGGQRDNKVYFKSALSTSLRATLYLNASAVSTEINEFGWFETDITGSVNGTKHLLFQGTGEPTGSLIPSPVGTTVIFTPTRYFGFYYSDVSEPACPNGGNSPCSPPVPVSGMHGCYAYTIFAFTDQRCLDAYGTQGDHDFVVFTSNPGSGNVAYWVVGEDPTDCGNKDGDCNLTIVKVSQVSRD